MRSASSTRFCSLLLFRDGLQKFVLTYRFVAQIIDLGDPSLEAFADFLSRLTVWLERFRRSCGGLLSPSCL